MKNMENIGDESMGVDIIELPNGKKIGRGQPVFIIAEAGINHQGDLGLAKRLIDIAYDSGADCVKFQKRTITRILTKKGLEMPYVNDNSFGKTYGEHKERLEFNYDQFRELKKYADKKGILFTASGWDEESVDFLDSLNVSFFKMASADLTNIPLLIHTARKKKPMIISTGMANEATVKYVYDLLRSINNKLAFLQCTSSYPSPLEEVNLRVMDTYKDVLQIPIVGFSGHEKGIEATISSVARGAMIIERHFTLSKTLRGSDHKCSLEPEELRSLIEFIRKIEITLGSSKKMIQPSEEVCIKKLTKSIVSNVYINKGMIITNDMLTIKGPGTGISPLYIDKIIGRRATCDIHEDEIILWDNITS